MEPQYNIGILKLILCHTLFTVLISNVTNGITPHKLSFVLSGGAFFLTNQRKPLVLLLTSDDSTANLISYFPRYPTTMPQCLKLFDWFVFYFMYSGYMYLKKSGFIGYILEYNPMSHVTYYIPQSYKYLFPLIEAISH